MVGKVLQGTGLGIISSIVIGILLGVTGLGIDWLGIGLMFILTYLITGYVAGREVEQPYVSSMMAPGSGPGLLSVGLIYKFFGVSFLLACEIRKKSPGSLPDGI